MSNTLQSPVLEPQLPTPESPLQVVLEFDSPEAQSVLEYVDSKALAWAMSLIDLSGVDESTRNHMYRVGFAAAETAKRLGMDPTQVQNSFLGGILHDLGKGDPDVLEAINYNGPLDPERRAIVDRHSALGARFIIEHGFTTGDESQQFENKRCHALTLSIAAIALGHHMYNAKHPYPTTEEIRKLVDEGVVNAGEMLKLLAGARSKVTKIVSAVDIVDAVTEHRPYRKKDIGLWEAFNIVEQEVPTVGSDVIGAVMSSYMHGISPVSDVHHSEVTVIAA